jgi:hypothetical protein
MARDNKKESISLTYTAQHLTARYFMFNNKVAGVCLLHVCLREESTNLRIQNVIRTWQSRDSLSLWYEGNHLVCQSKGLLNS